MLFARSDGQIAPTKGTVKTIKIVYPFFPHVRFKKCCKNHAVLLSGQSPLLSNHTRGKNRKMEMFCRLPFSLRGHDRVSLSRTMHTNRLRAGYIMMYNTYTYLSLVAKGSLPRGHVHH